ncbi:unnamed protein product [Candidula unifasciata]|uniref:LRAT domain-containing protein n=1 Tax=Candidula unifasciata TaxID=100452 RepID=A0A8S3ZXH9_9EUPU|nr:unnamed protein product [Candidula unifasciata]
MDQGETRRHNEEILRRARSGDLLEFPRELGYSHWGVYVGTGYVIHLAGEPGDGLSTADVTVRKDSFWTVAGNSRARINNIFDGVERLQPAKEIVKRAESKVGHRGYDLVSTNCEHFATWCRYDVARSSQVEAVQTAVSSALDNVEEVLRNVAENHPDCEGRSAARRWLAVGQAVIQLKDHFMQSKTDPQLKGLSSNK